MQTQTFSRSARAAEFFVAALAAACSSGDLAIHSRTPVFCADGATGESPLTLEMQTAARTGMPNVYRPGNAEVPVLINLVVPTGLHQQRGQLTQLAWTVAVQGGDDPDRYATNWRVRDENPDSTTFNQMIGQALPELEALHDGTYRGRFALPEPRPVDENGVWFSLLADLREETPEGILVANALAYPPDHVRYPYGTLAFDAECEAVPVEALPNLHEETGGPIHAVRIGGEDNTDGE